MPREKNKNIYDIDQLISQTLRKKREALGISRKELSNVLGISTQQLAKYENGDNRISCGKLQTIAKEFEVPINYFFEDNV